MKYSWIIIDFFHHHFYSPPPLADVLLPEILSYFNKSDRIIFKNNVRKILISPCIWTKILIAAFQNIFKFLWRSFNFIYFLPCFSQVLQILVHLIHFFWYIENNKFIQTCKIRWWWSFIKKIITFYFYSVWNRVTAPTYFILSKYQIFIFINPKWI